MRRLRASGLTLTLQADKATSLSLLASREDAARFGQGYVGRQQVQYN